MNRLNVVKSLNEDSNPIAYYYNNNERYFVEITDKPTINTELSKLDNESLKKILKDDIKNIPAIINLLQEKLLNEGNISDNGKKFELNINDLNDSIMFLPDIKKEREMVYMFGPSGSGKSFLTKLYALEYNKFYPDNQIFVVSRIKDDPSFEGLEYIHIPINKEILSNIDVTTFNDSLVIFDDTETQDKPTNRLIDSLKDLIAQEGRHYKVSMIITTHMACNYNRTRIILNECHKYVIFPQSNGVKQMQNMFCTYGGLSKEKFLSIKSEFSRWCMLNITYPNYLVYSNKIELL